MAKNENQILFIIGLVVLIMISMQESDKKETDINGFQIASAPISLASNKITQVNKFPYTAVESITYDKKTGSLIPGIEGKYCCTLSCESDNFCDSQCTGPEDFCQAWCDERDANKCGGAGEIIETCPSGTVMVGNGRCCPTSYPNYCSQDNLCYKDANCGVGIIGAVSCRTDNALLECNQNFLQLGGLCGGTAGVQTTLFRSEEIPFVGACNVDCANDWNEAKGTNEQGLRACGCYTQRWNNVVIGEKLHDIIPSYLPDKSNCNSCSNGLCVKSDSCSFGEIKCVDSSHYTSCERISNQYFLSPFNDFGNTIKSCPAGNICSNNACVPDLSSVCNDVKGGVLSAITAWANSPSETAKSQILTKITTWAEIC